jgi:quercetin dioxygenase-like cupin family protein
MRTFPVQLIAILLMGLLNTTSLADESIDALVSSPDRFKLLLENDEVRVLEYQLLPGQRDEWHTHPPKVSYVVSGGTLRISLKDGSSFEVTETTGAAAWMNALGAHFAENVGSTPVRIVLVEVKSAARGNGPVVASPGPAPDHN